MARRVDARARAVMRLPFGVAIALLSTPATTDLLRLGAAASDAGLPPGWTVRAVRGVAAPAARVMDSAGMRFLRIEGQGTAAWFGQRFALAAAPGARLRWRWRIPVTPVGADLRVQQGDDAAARIFVSFDTPTFLGRPPRTLFYSSGGAEPEGYARASFVSGSLHVIRITPPPTGTWADVTVDPVADYTRIFGRPPPHITGVGVMQDSEHTGSRAVADLAALVWTAP